MLFDWNSFTNEVTYGGDVAGVLGYAPEELTGGFDAFRRIIHPEDVDAFDQEIQRVLATRDPFRLGFRVRHRDGRALHIDAKGYFFLDRQGKFGRMVGFLGDVTVAHLARLQLASAQETLETRVVERTAELARANSVIQERAMQQGVVASLGQRALSGVPLDALLPDAAHVVRETLDVDFCSILKLSPDGSSVVPIAEAGWPRPLDQAFGIRHQSISGYTLLVRCPVIVEDMTTETRFEVPDVTHQSGARSCVSVVIESGGEPMGVLIAFTVHPRSFTQDDINFLQSVANVLTAAMDRRRAEEIVKAARIQAEEANRAKSEFLSRMSHELRTPLNAILGFSQLLEIDEPTPSQAESVAHILRAGNHLLTLINEVLDIARIESGRLALAPDALSLPAFIHECIGATRLLAERESIALIIDQSCDEEINVSADYQRLKQVLLNLLNNAVKYNRPHGRVVVSVTENGSRARINVSDTGFGIPDDQVGKLFVPFERLGAESTGVDGTGIGLALSQRIVTALNGELGVNTEPGEGSTFWVELPRSRPAPAEGADDDGGGGSSRRERTILYVEDEDMNLRLVERILSQQTGYRLIPVMQSTAALERARKHQPDLILLDLNLPEIPGSEILRQLKADPKLWTIPVVMISADVTADRIDELMEMGATGYLTKPYRVREFLDCIEKVLV
ncbi:MAG: ATP-binding protein [Chthoniobacteraceae bacterium]